MQVHSRHRRHRTLERLAAHCPGDKGPDYPILDDLVANGVDARAPVNALPPTSTPVKRQAAFR